MTQTTHTDGGREEDLMDRLERIDRNMREIAGNDEMDDHYSQLYDEFGEVYDEAESRGLVGNSSADSPDAR